MKATAVHIETWQKQLQQKISSAEKDNKREAIASRLEAIAIVLEAIAIRFLLQTE